MLDVQRRMPSLQWDCHEENIFMWPWNTNAVPWRSIYLQLYKTVWNGFKMWPPLPGTLLQTLHKKVLHRCSKEATMWSRQNGALLSQCRCSWVQRSLQWEAGLWTYLFWWLPTVSKRSPSHPLPIKVWTYSSMWPRMQFSMYPDLSPMHEAM